MKAEQSTWAEGYGFSDETVAALNKIAAESATKAVDLSTGDLSEWCARLEHAGFPELAARVRELPEYS